MTKKNINTPLILIVLLFFTGILPSVFSVNGIGEELESTFVLGGGFIAVDVVLLIMLASVLTKIILIKSDTQIRDRFLLLAISGFCVWLIFETVRNIKNYGLSAPGEFRFRYLILVIPIYIAFYFDTKLKRKRLLKVLIFVSFFLPLLVIPYKGILYGWQFGFDSRYFNSQIHLGMLYGFITFLLLLKYKQISVSHLFVIIMSVLYLFFFLNDSRRSVWLAFTIILLVLIFLKEFKIQKTLYFIPLIILIIISISLQFQTLGINLGSYIIERGTAFISPEKDGTATWRLLIWQAQFESFLTTPFLGQGFGGYWYSYIPQIGVVEFQPHNFYIQSLAKIGIIGLALYFIIYIRIFKNITKKLKEFRCSENTELPLIISGIAIFISAHFYYTVYSLDYYSLIFIGLTIAVTRDKGLNSPEN